MKKKELEIKQLEQKLEKLKQKWPGAYKMAEESLNMLLAKTKRKFSKEAKLRWLISNIQMRLLKLSKLAAEYEAYKMLLKGKK